MAAFGFTRASEQDVFSIEPAAQISSKTDRAVSGEEVRLFYENLVKDDKDQDTAKSGRSSKGHGREQQQKKKGSNRRERRRTRAAEAQQHQTDAVVQRRAEGERDGDQRGGTNSSERSMELLGLRLLRCAHEGDTPGLRDLITKGVDINFQDSFFWTAMMCASWSGQKAVVKLLLQHGAAWVGVVDMQGRDAKDLALEAGHGDVLEELESYGRSTATRSNPGSSVSQPQWCRVCCSEYSSSLSSHLSSTLHQFSLRRPSPTPYYCLPPSSNSYKMMLRSGWKPGTGLGPEGEGSKQPVATVLKRDQAGLGYGDTKRAKVTHFQARDRDAVKLPSKYKQETRGKGQRKEDSRRKEQKDKNWERDFRASFYL